MIAVNLVELALALGADDWTELLLNDHQRMAARVITDFRGSKTPDVAIKNATAWIGRAYDSGQSAGIALERRRWQKKLATLFDIPIERA